MSSFFLKKQPRGNNKRKFRKGTNGKIKKPKFNGSVKNPKILEKNNNIEDDDEILSDDEEEATLNAAADIEFSDDEIVQTPQDKRLQIAKAYLEEIEKEERSRADDKIENNISQRLTDDYLDTIGKLKKPVADQFSSYDDTNIQILKHKLQKLPLTCLCLSNDNNYFFTGSKTQFIIKWDFKTMKPIGTIDIATTSINNSAATVASKKSKEKKEKKCRTQIMALALSTDFKFLAIADLSFDIQIYCPEKLTHIHTFKGHRDLVTGIVFRKDSHQLYSASKDRSIKIWSLDEMAYLESLFGHQAHVTGIDALTRERAISSGGMDCSIRIWKITEESQLVYNGHKGSIENVKLINEENFLSCGDDGSLCVWSSMKKKPISVMELAHGKQINDEANWISSIATIINSDMIASGSNDGFIKIWKLSDNYRKIILKFEIPVKGFVNALKFTNDGSKLIAIVAQEHRLGRWWRIKEANNCIMIFALR